MSGSIPGSVRIGILLLLVASASCDGPGRSGSVGHGMRTLPGNIVALYGTTEKRLEFVFLHPQWRTTRTLDPGTGVGASGTFFALRIEFADGRVLEYDCRPASGKGPMNVNGQAFDLAKGRVFFVARRGNGLEVSQANFALPPGGVESLDRLTETITDLPRRLEDRHP